MAQSKSPQQERQRERRAALLEAASQVFFEAGYEGASIDAVIARVGGSKRTLYNEFGSKEGLFAAIVTENVSQALAALAPDEVRGHDLRSTLMEFGCRLMRLQMSPSVCSLYRLVIAEGTRFPQLAKAFYDSGPGHASARLAEVLETFRAKGELRITDCQRAADQFFGMLRDDLHLRVVLGLRKAPAAKEVEATVEAAVDIFLNGIQARQDDRQADRTDAHASSAPG